MKATRLLGVQYLFIIPKVNNFYCLKAKQIVQEYEKQLNISVVIPRFSNLKDGDKSGIHEVLFQMDILELVDDDKLKNIMNNYQMK